MTNAVRLKDLSDKHHQLDTLIEEEMSRPMADTLKITQLKREKLRIKEEIANIEAQRQSA